MAKPHVVLGIAPDATFEQAREAYQRLAMRHHPDRGGDAVEFRRVQAAYEALRAKVAAVGPFDDIFDTLSREYKAS